MVVLSVGEFSAEIFSGGGFINGSFVHLWFCLGFMASAHCNVQVNCDSLSGVNRVHCPNNTFYLCTY